MTCPWPDLRNPATGFCSWLGRSVSAGRALGRCASTSASTRRRPRSGGRREQVRGSKRAAQRALVELVGETVVSRRARSTVAALLEQWCSAASPAWAVSTVRQVRSVLNHHLIPALGAIKVGELTTSQVDAFYGDLGHEGLSAGTVRRVHGVLHAGLAQAQRWEWMRSDVGVVMAELIRSGGSRAPYVRRSRGR